jgi:signal transduction histidine kinase
MSRLHINILFVPFIALLLVIFLYIKLYRKANDKHAFKRFIFLVIVLSYLLNLIWELLHVPLYESLILPKNHAVLCILASLADVIMVLLLYFGLAIVYKDPLWVKSLSSTRVLITMMVGGMGAILSETRHIAAGNWEYAISMPILPIVGVGVTPVLQFIILPILIYYSSFYFFKFYNLDHA